jgi:hypothetical protein
LQSSSDRPINRNHSRAYTAHHPTVKIAFQGNRSGAEKEKAVWCATQLRLPLAESDRDFPCLLSRTWPVMTEREVNRQFQVSPLKDITQLDYLYSGASVFNQKSFGSRYDSWSNGQPPRLSCLKNCLFHLCRKIGYT